MFYYVGIKEVCIQTVQIEASSPEAALQKVEAGEGDHLSDPEYSHTLDKDEWSIVECG